MKRFFIIPAFLLSCHTQIDKGASLKQAKVDTIIQHDTIHIEGPKRDWIDGFTLTRDPDVDTIFHKPASYYLDDPACAEIASDFYYGILQPSDNGATAELLRYTCSDNNKLRPFYRWCLNITIIIQDGALAEYTGIPARQYAEKFPKEFFEYMDADTTKEKYINWTGAISYSGFYDIDDYKKPAAIRERMTRKMKQNCKDCNTAVMARIDKLAMDCFP